MLKFIDLSLNHMFVPRQHGSMAAWRVKAKCGQAQSSFQAHYTGPGY